MTWKGGSGGWLVGWLDGKGGWEGGWMMRMKICFSLKSPHDQITLGHGWRKSGN